MNPSAVPGLGGQTSISPPAKVKNLNLASGGENCFDVLLTGIDTLALAVNAVWQDEALFARLHAAKEKAKAAETPRPFVLHDQGDSQLYFEVRPYGIRGYDWLLVGHDFSLRIANAKRPKSRPNIYIEIRSEALWNLGPGYAVALILDALKANNAELHEVKISRLDLCADVLMPDAMFTPGLLDFAVSRARDAILYYRRGKKTFLTGMYIGRGAISARLYDKPLEIQDRSNKKQWMYDLWKLEEVPEGHRVIRVEFQIRREPLKELGLDSVWDAFSNLEHAWAYCTQKWLKFSDRPGNHHTMRKTLDWWIAVQDNFAGMCGGVPLVREKAIKAEEKQLRAQAFGLLTSLAALAENEKDKPDVENVFAKIREVFEEKLMQHASGSKLQGSVELKRAKYRRGGNHD